MLSTMDGEVFEAEVLNVFPLPEGTLAVATVKAGLCRVGQDLAILDAGKQIGLARLVSIRIVDQPAQQAAVGECMVAELLGPSVGDLRQGMTLGEKTETRSPGEASTKQEDPRPQGDSPLKEGSASPALAEEVLTQEEGAYPPPSLASRAMTSQSPQAVPPEAPGEPEPLGGESPSPAADALKEPLPPRKFWTAATLVAVTLVIVFLVTLACVYVQWKGHGPKKPGSAPQPQSHHPVNKLPWPFDAAEAARRQAEAAKALGVPAEISLQLDGNVSLQLALIPPGTFMMGTSDEQAEKEVAILMMAGVNRQSAAPFIATEAYHEVTLTKPFCMGALPVTQEQYEAVLGENPSNLKDAKIPVNNVSWFDAARFCQKLSQITHRCIHLPTEAQREYACRAGTATRYSFGDEESALGDYAWYRDNSGEANNSGRPYPAGLKKPNPWGLYDMHGNVWEWCADLFTDSFDPGQNIDPVGPASGARRVLRGGRWGNHAFYCRSACRWPQTPEHHETHYGFRVVMDVEATTTPTTSPAPPRP